MAPRSMAGVEHLVSRVTGTVRPEVALPQLLGALFPGGSVTGAPKVAAIDQIARLEPVGRGASMGALGTIRPNGDLDLALTIRTFAVADGRIHLWVGGGIVWDSDPAAEVEESWVKARPLLAAIGAGMGCARCGTRAPGPCPARARARMKPVAVAVLGRGVVDPDAAGPRRGRRGARPGHGRVRDHPGVRRSGVRARRASRPIARIGRSAGAARCRPRADLEQLARAGPRGLGTPDAALRFYWTGGRDGARTATALATVTPIPGDPRTVRARGLRVASLELGIDRDVADRSPWLLAGVKSTSYAVHVAAVAEAAVVARMTRSCWPRTGTSSRARRATSGGRRDGCMRTPGLDIRHPGRGDPGAPACGSATGLGYASRRAAGRCRGARCGRGVPVVVRARGGGGHQHRWAADGRWPTPGRGAWALQDRAPSGGDARRAERGPPRATRRP